MLHADMPELPDITVYVECLQRRIVDETLERVQIMSPALLRTVSPSTADAEGRSVRGVRRLGKRVVIETEDELFLVFHLMIAGRLRWREGGGKVPRRATLAVMEFSSGTLWLTEASSKRRASLHLLQGESALAQHDPGGIEVLESDLAAFEEALLRENHTLKRSLTDPHLFSGIGNAYSDEILHQARLSPVKWTQRLASEEIERLHDATLRVLTDWTERLRQEVGDGFPEKVTAFHAGMAVHGRYGEPCPECGQPVQRIVYAGHETNYCAPCQTDGKLLADRALSRLLGKDWPRSLEALEARRQALTRR